MFKSHPQSSVEFSDEYKKAYTGLFKKSRNIENEVTLKRQTTSLPRYSSTTVEKISIEEWKKLFRKILDERTIPEINLLSLIAPLPKPDKDPSKAGSYRPVSLTEVFIRVMEKTLKIKMVEHAECFGLFGAGQHGFRKKHSTTSNILHPHERIIKQLDDYG